METLAISTVLFFILSIMFALKFFKLRKSIKKFEEIGTGRYGFYVNKHFNTDKNSYVYVKEVDRYSNGYSEIILDRVEPLKRSYSSDAIDNARNNFISLKLTNDIEWLEGEEHLRKLRKEKLEKIKKI